jgi:hypothetical protein
MKHTPGPLKSRHWKRDDFIVTTTTPAYDGTTPAMNCFGYCRVCKSDMQSFAGNGLPGPIKHYSSHQYARRHGIEWKRG